MLVSAKIADRSWWGWFFNYTAAAYTYYHAVRAMGLTHFKYRSDGDVVIMEDIREEYGLQPRKQSVVAMCMGRDECRLA